MIAIYFWQFIILCGFALGGLVAFIFLFNILVIDPIRDIVRNYKFYRKFYIEHFEDDLEEDEVEEDE